MPKTIGETYGPAMKITTQEEADAYFEQLVNECIAREPMSREKAESIQKQNLGYYAGYYDDATRERVERLFMCAHPIFGAIAHGKPTADDALEAGRRMAIIQKEISMSELQFGTQVVYIPTHLEKKLLKLLDIGNDKFIAMVQANLAYSMSVRFGFVQNTSSRVPDSIFCRYWLTDNLKELRTKGNSELTPLACLHEFQSVPQDRVNRAQEWIADEDMRILGF